MKVTLTDLANELGISRTTISNALYNKGRISEDIRAQILDAVKKSGYRPNKLVHSIQKGKSDTIAVFLSLGGSDYFNTIYSGAYQTIRGEGYLPIHFQHSFGINQEDLVNELIDRRVDGFLCDSSFKVGSESLAKAFYDRDIPVVMLSQKDPEIKKADFVGTDDELGGKLAAEHLIQHGHKKVIQLLGSELQDLTNSVYINRDKAFKKVFKKHEAQVIDIVLGDQLPEEVMNQILNCLASAEPATACFCHDHHLIHLTQALRHAGLLIGKDFSVISFGATKTSQALQLTTIDQKPFSIGSDGARLLIDHIKGSRSKTKNILIKPELIDNKSVLYL